MLTDPNVAQVRSYTAFAVVYTLKRSSMLRTMKIWKLKLFYFQKNARYRAKKLCRDIFLGNLSLKVGKISVGLLVLILEFW